MSKKSRRAHRTGKPHGPKTSSGGGKQAGPAELLRRFKLLWSSQEWPQALISYREWTNRTGAGRDPRLEGELLYRSASWFFEQGNYGQAARHLEEAAARDPESRKRCLPALAITRAGQGDLSGALGIFRELGDDFHAALVSRRVDCGRPLPDRPSGSPELERSELLRFWNGLDSSRGADLASGPLRQLDRAFRSFVTGEGDPEPPLKLLGRTEGFEGLSARLLLLLTVRERNTVKFRNLLRGRRWHLEGEAALELLDVHLQLLVRETNFDEIEYLDAMLREFELIPSRLAGVRDELNFQRALEQIGRGRWEKALSYIRQMAEFTPAALHNRALLLQHLERYGEANRDWTTLLARESRPRRSDPPERRIAYATTLKYIGENYLREEMPEEALPRFKEALELIEDDRESLEALLNISEMLQRPADVLRYAQRLHELEPDDDDHLLALSAALRALDRSEELIPLYERRLEQHPGHPLYQAGLDQAYLHNAWSLRHRRPEEAQELLRRAGREARKDPLAAYLRGYFLLRAGEADEAEAELEQAFRGADGHWEELFLAKGFLEDGMAERAAGLFERILDCDCPLGERIFYEQIVPFLASRGDPEILERVCDHAVHESGYNPGILADLLLDLDRPERARRYSALLVAARPDRNDRFLHLLILNRAGEREEALSTAESLLEDARARDDPADIAVFKDIVKQLRTRRRARIPYEYE